MPTSNLLFHQRLYWYDCRSVPLLSELNKLQDAGIHLMNVGLAVALRFGAEKPNALLGTLVEEHLTKELHGKASTQPDIRLPIIAIHNLGILFEPQLGLNPNIWIRRMTKSLIIVLVWTDQFQPPGLFYWNTSLKKYVLNLNDAVPQQLILSE